MLLEPMEEVELTILEETDIKDTVESFMADS